MDSKADTVKRCLPSLKRSFAWQMIGNLMAAAAQWLVLCVLTKTTTDEITGQFVLASTLCTPLFMFASLDLRVWQATDAFGEFSFADYLATRLIAGGLAFLVSVGIALGIGLSDNTLLVVASLAAGKYVELLAETFHGLMQRHERSDLVSRSLMLRAVAQCVALSIGIVATDDLITALWTSFGASCSLLFLVDIPLVRPLLVEAAQHTSQPSLWRQPIELRSLRRLTGFGLPLAVKSLMISLIPSTARYFIVAFHGLATLGIFGPIASLTIAALMVSRSLNPAVAPRLAGYVASGDETRFRRLLSNLRWCYALLGIVAIAVAALFGEPILTLLLREDLARHSGVFVLLVVSTAIQFQGGILDLALVTLRRIESLAPVTGLTLAVMAVACWLMVPSLGMEGAALAITVSWLVRITCVQFTLSRALSEAFPARSLDLPQATERIAA